MIHVVYLNLNSIQISCSNYLRTRMILFAVELVAGFMVGLGVEFIVELVAELGVELIADFTAEFGLELVAGFTIDLIGVDLIEVDLIGVDLIGADFTADFIGGLIADGESLLSADNLLTEGDDLLVVKPIFVVGFVIVSGCVLLFLNRI